MGNARPCMSVVPRMTTCARWVTARCAEVWIEMDSARRDSANKPMTTDLFLVMLWSQIAARTYRRAEIGRDGINFRRRVALNASGMLQSQSIAHLLQHVFI